MAAPVAPAPAWSPVVDGEGRYSVSSDGEVWSIERIVVDTRGRRQRHGGRMLAPWLDGDGYPRVTLALSAGQVQRPVHVLVARAFIGPCPDGEQVRHRNGVRTECGALNLLYGTPAENSADRDGHGTLYRERCRRDHLLIPANLDSAALRAGTRVCRACRLATAVVRRGAARGELLDVALVAHRYAAQCGAVPTA